MPVFTASSPTRIVLRINICRHLEIVFEAFQIQNIPGSAAGSGKCAVQGIIIRKEPGYLLLKGIRQAFGRCPGDPVRIEFIADGIAGPYITVPMKQHPAGMEYPGYGVCCLPGVSQYWEVLLRK